MGSEWGQRIRIHMNGVSVFGFTCSRSFSTAFPFPAALLGHLAENLRGSGRMLVGKPLPLRTEDWLGILPGLRRIGVSTQASGFCGIPAGANVAMEMGLEGPFTG